jgi:hypothetical protein
MRASLDGGITAYIEEVENDPHIEWQLEADAAKSELEIRVQSAEEDADRKTASLLDQGKAAVTDGWGQEQTAGAACHDHPQPLASTRGAGLQVASRCPHTAPSCSI